MTHARQAMAALVPVGLLLLAAGCGPHAGEICPPSTLASIQSAYAAKVVALCKGHEFDSCDAVPALKADRYEAEVKAGCR